MIYRCEQGHEDRAPLVTGAHDYTLCRVCFLPTMLRVEKEVDDGPDEPVEWQWDL